MRLILNVQFIAVKGCLELDRFEESVRPGTRKYRYTFRSGVELIGEPRLNTRPIRLKALAGFGLRVERTASRRQLLADPGFELGPSTIIGLRVQIKADYRRGGRGKVRQFSQPILGYGVHI